MSRQTHVARTAVAVLASVVLLQSKLVAQDLDVLSRVALQVNVDDHVVATDRADHITAGRLLRMSNDALVIETTDGPRTISGSQLTQLNLRVRHTRTAVLVGAAAGIVTGAIAACTGADRRECGDGALMAGAAGAGIGAVLSALFVREVPVYRASGGAAPAGAALSPATVEVLQHANVNDVVRVKRSPDETISGRLRDASGDDLMIVSREGEVIVRAAAIQRLRVRRYQPVRGALIGAAAFAALALAAPACRNNDDCSPIAAAAFGAAAGLAVGELVPRMVTVFPARAGRAAWTAAVSRGRVGVNASLRW